MNVVFSIVIPTYNRAEFIRETIQSVLNQTFTNFEIIVVDDGSTDNTAQVVKSINDERIIYINKKNEERAVARNTGCKLARGKYVTFFDSDDVLYPHHLQVAHQTIESNSEIAVFHLGYDIKNEKGEIIKTVNKLNATANQQLIKGNMLSCNGVFINREVAIQNPFNPDRKLSALEDWELWLRLAPRYPIYCINQITSTVVNHDFRSVLQTNKEALIVRFESMLESILTNKEVTDYYKSDIHLFKSSCYSYIALHIALTKKSRKDSLSYMMKAIKENPKFVFSKRCLAIIKHFI